MKKKHIASNIVLFVCLTILLFAALYLGSLLLNYHKSNAEYDNIRQTIISNFPETEEDSFPIDWEALKEVNPDVVAWIRFPSLDISYPIVQGTDNDQYLHTTVEGTSAYAGAIFLDAACSQDFSDDNTVIYGHNMRNRSMFGNLKFLYRDEAVLRENEYFWIYTPTDTYKCNIFSLGNMPVADERFHFVDGPDEQKAAYIQFCMEKNQYKMPVRAELSDRIITLSTCVATRNDSYRLQIHAVIEKK